MLLVGFVDIHFPSILVVFHSTFKVLHSLAQQTQLYRCLICSEANSLIPTCIDTQRSHWPFSVCSPSLNESPLRLPTSSTSTMPKKIQPIRVSQHTSSLSRVGQSSLSRWLISFWVSSYCLPDIFLCVYAFISQLYFSSHYSLSGIISHSKCSEILEAWFLEASISYLIF